MSTLADAVLTFALVFAIWLDKVSSTFTGAVNVGEELLALTCCPADLFLTILALAATGIRVILKRVKTLALISNNCLKLIFT